MANNAELQALENQVKELRELKRMEEELTAEIEQIQDQIKAYMTLKGTDELTGPDFKISWKEMISRRFDSKAFKAANAELYDAFSIVSTVKRFSLS